MILLITLPWDWMGGWYGWWGGAWVVWVVGWCMGGGVLGCLPIAYLTISTPSRSQRQGQGKVRIQGGHHQDHRANRQTRQAQ